MPEILHINKLNFDKDTVADFYAKSPAHILKKSVMFIRPDFSAKICDIREIGYTTVVFSSIHEAKNFLISECSRNHATPAAILCDTEIAEHLIRHFAGFLSINSELKQIPFLLVANENSFPSNQQYTHIQGVDDMISLDASAKDLLEKIKFLKKYKSLKSKLPYHSHLPEKKQFNLKSFVSRISDIVISGVLLLLLLPFFLVIAIAIKLGSKGPVFYISPRAGRDYKVFNFYKFRTMMVDADKKIDEIRHLNQYDNSATLGTVFIKIEKDPRVTKLGRFLRNTSIDELPQLINVFLGDMSLVGNRPLPLYEASSLTIDETAKRFLAPAGITGLWQTKKRGKPDMIVQERINLDIDYANKHGFLFDLKILLLTPFGLIQKTDV